MTNDNGAKLAVRLESPPKYRVTLSIDNASGNHYELVWDPAVNDGLQHEVLLPKDTWTLIPSAELERITAKDTVFTFFTTFKPGVLPAGSTDVAWFEGTNRVFVAGVGAGSGAGSAAGGAPGNSIPGMGDPAWLKATCHSARVELSELHLDKRQVAAAAKARGLLDQTVPTPVTATLQLLTDVAVERAKSGAVSLLQDRFVTPLCNELSLAMFHLGGTDRAFPRTCSLASKMRLEDVLGSGHALLTAAQDDLRETLLPALVNKIVPDEESRTLAALALQFASGVLNGNTEGVVEIDYLVSILDNTPFSIGLDRDTPLVARWINEAVVSSKTQLDVVKKSVLEAALPRDFDDVNRIDDRPWGKIDACRPPPILSVTDLLSARRVFGHADRTKCIAALTSSFLAHEDWFAQGVDHSLFRADEAVEAIHSSLHIPFSRWVEGTWMKDARDEIEKMQPEKMPERLTELVNKEIGQLSDRSQHALESACEVRLLVGVAKWCSTQEACSAGEVASIIRDPAKLFKRTNHLPEAVCWKSETQYRTPEDIKPYIDLGSRLIAFLAPEPQAEKQTRVIAMIEWIFDVVAVINASDDSPASQRLHEQIVRMKEVIRHLVDHDYATALTNAMAVAQSLRCHEQTIDRQLNTTTGPSIDVPGQGPVALAGVVQNDLEGGAGGTCKMPAAATRTLQLLGAIAAYADTYEQTKDTNTDAARDARKKALENLLDMASDRRDRDGDRVVSIGSTVGLAVSWQDEFSREDGHWNGNAVAVRVPITLSWQQLPGRREPSNPDRFERHYRPSWFGYQLGLQVADLGQFIQNSSDKVTWSTFVAPGVEASMLFGEPHRSIALSAFASYVPTLTDDARPIWRYGLSLGFYVPFIDLN